MHHRIHITAARRIARRERGVIVTELAVGLLLLAALAACLAVVKVLAG